MSAAAYRWPTVAQKNAARKLRTFEPLVYAGRFGKPEPHITKSYNKSKAVASPSALTYLSGGTEPVCSRMRRMLLFIECWLRQRGA